MSKEAAANCVGWTLGARRSSLVDGQVDKVSSRTVIANIQIGFDELLGCCDVGFVRSVSASDTVRLCPNQLTIVACFHSKSIEYQEAVRDDIRRR